MGGEATPEYISEQSYYLITKGGKFHQVELNKEAILNGLSNFQNKIKEYSAKHNLNFGKVNDLQKILAYYESLINVKDKKDFNRESFTSAYNFSLTHG